MTKAKYQALWRDRKSKGLIKTVTCPICNQPSRADSKRSPLHYKCWLKTDEGREYLRQKKQESRQK